MKFEQRMYCISLRHLSSIQKGVQNTHTLAEYARLYGNNSEYKQWVSMDKTLIFLECNSSNELTNIFARIKFSKHVIVDFYEPDLQNIRTSISFLADERVWNVEKYPQCTNEKIKTLRDLISPLRLAT